MNSATVLGGKSLLTTSTKPLIATALIGAKSLIGSWLSLLIAGAIVIGGVIAQSRV